MTLPENIAVRVDHDLCVGNAMCRSLAPTAFVANRDGQSVVSDSLSEPVENLLEAAALCPVGAISLVDKTTGQELDA